MVKIEKMIINHKADCVGCYACYNICPVNAIMMKADEEGFSYPKVDNLRCIKCEKCGTVCPSLNFVKKTSQADPETLAAYCLDEAVLNNSSSGGIFHLLAMKILEAGGIVIGAGFNKCWEVEHKIAENSEELLELQTSKYVQSRIGSTFKIIKDELKTGRWVLFSGTPCQCAGLQKYLGRVYDNLLLIDFVCHGVPSPLVWQKYLKLRVKKVNEIQRISFRDKNLSWERYLLKISLKNSNKYLADDLEHDLYLKGFLNNLYLRPSCHKCKFCQKNRSVDITLADFWGVKEEVPSMYNSKGTSLVFIHSKQGKHIFKSLPNIKLQYINFMQGVKYNPSMIKSVETPVVRKNFWKEFYQNSNRLSEIIIKYTKTNKKTELKKFLKKIPFIYQVFKIIKMIIKGRYNIL